MENIVVLRSAINENLVLEAYNGGDGFKVVLAWIDPHNVAQQWYRTDNGNTLKLTNVATKQDMGAGALNWATPIVLRPEGKGNWWHAAEVGNYSSIRLSGSNTYLTLHDGNMNLGTLATAESGGGDRKQLWNMENLSTVKVPAKRESTVILSSNGLGLMDSGDKYTLEAIGNRQGDPLFIYNMLGWHDFSIDREQRISFSFQNQKTGKFIGYGGDRQPLVPYGLMCIEALWTLADAGLGRSGVRPWVNPGMNWNVFSGEAAKIGVWNWGGGQPNEVWTLKRQ
jgi:hypothetical protein